MGRDKPLVVEGDAARTVIARMTPYTQSPSQPKTVWAVKMTQPFVVVQDADDAPIRGRMEAVAGCYLVMSSPGVFYPVTADVFERSYTAKED
jgi:hypothetical protein